MALQNIGFMVTATGHLLPILRITSSGLKGDRRDNGRFGRSVAQRFITEHAGEAASRVILTHPPAELVIRSSSRAAVPCRFRARWRVRLLTFLHQIPFRRD
jgi:hypothetical protein